MPPIINVTKLNKSFSKYSILDNISIQIEPGTVYGLVGLNGAGKTTLLRLLTGLLKPDNGTVSVLNCNPWEHKREYYQKIGVVLENDGFWGNLSVKDNLAIYASAKGLNNSEIERYIDEYWKNSEILKNTRKVKTLSRGQRMQCGLCRAFMGWPEVYFLDEPALALDMTAYEHMCSIIRHAQKRGAAMIISSHQLDTIDKLCDRVGILQDKRIQELEKEKPDSVSGWQIVTENLEQYGKIIKDAGGEEIVYDNGYYFKIDTPKTIPLIIKNLVAVDCKIYEVKRLQDGFSNTIRNYYNSKKEGFNDRY